MSIYLRKEMRGECGPYFRLEQKYWDRKLRKLRTRQLKYFGKLENIPLNIREKYQNLIDPGHQTATNGLPPIGHIPPTTAKTESERLEKDKEFVHGLYEKYYGEGGDDL